MDEIMSQLHPALSPGPFDLATLLKLDPPQDWKPEEEGDTIMGFVHKITTATRDDYSFPVLELIDSNGLVWRVRCSSMILKNAITDLKIVPGNIVSITYDGSKKSQSSGRTYKLHTVRKL